MLNDSTEGCITDIKLKIKFFNFVSFVWIIVNTDSKKTMNTDEYNFKSINIVCRSKQNCLQIWKLGFYVNVYLFIK